MDFALRLLLSKTLQWPVRLRSCDTLNNQRRIRERSRFWDIPGTTITRTGWLEWWRRNTEPGTHIRKIDICVCTFGICGVLQYCNGKCAGRGTPNNLSAYGPARSAYEIWAGQFENLSVLPFQTFEAERPSKRQTTTALVHQKKAKVITVGSSRPEVPEIRWSSQKPRRGGIAVHQQVIGPTSQITTSTGVPYVIQAEPRQISRKRKSERTRAEDYFAAVAELCRYTRKAFGCGAHCAAETFLAARTVRHVIPPVLSNLVWRAFRSLFSIFGKKTPSASLEIICSSAPTKRSTFLWSPWICLFG